MRFSQFSACLFRKQLLPICNPNTCAGLNSPSDQINTVDDKTVELDAIEQLVHLQQISDQTTSRIPHYPANFSIIVTYKLMSAKSGKITKFKLVNNNLTFQYMFMVCCQGPNFRVFQILVVTSSSTCLIPQSQPWIRRSIDAPASSFGAVNFVTRNKKGSFHLMTSPSCLGSTCHLLR